MKSNALRLPTEMANAGTAAKEARSTHFTFEHKVFSVPSVFFALTEDRKPAMHISYGDLRAAIELRSVRSGFSIPQHSADDHMLGVVEGSLRFVRKIRPNDSIPREVLDGTASWAIDESHHMTAHSRLTVQLASWMTGKTSTTTMTGFGPFPITTESSSRDKAHIDTVSLYAQDEWSLADAVKLTTGLRLNHTQTGLDETTVAARAK